MSQEINWLQGRTILVTGGTGYLAANLVRRLRPLNCRIVRLSRTLAHGTEAPDGMAQVTEFFGDVREKATWEQLTGAPDFILHLAAQTSVYTAGKDPVADWQANVLPMLHLLELCRVRGWRPGLVFAGSATQYGLAEKMPVDDATADHPVTVYDVHKLAAEAHLRLAVGEGRVHGATLRLANVYGPGPAGRTADRGILNQMVRRALRGEAITLYGDGAQVRDYVYVDDVVEAFLAAARRVDQLQGGHYVIGTGTGHTLAAAFRLVAERVERLTGRRVAVDSVEPPANLSPIEQRNFVADSSRFRAATGWAPRVRLEEGIDRAVAFFRELEASSK